MIENKKVFDAHVHVGQLYGEYHSPEEVSQLMKECGVDYYVVSSATVCQGDYDKALTEIRKLIGLDREKVYPSLWLTPELLQNPHLLDKFLESEIQWKCVEFHSSLLINMEPEDNLYGSNAESESCRTERLHLKESVAIAHRLRVPLLIHIGNDSCPNNDKLTDRERCALSIKWAEKFISQNQNNDNILEKNPNVNFIISTDEDIKIEDHPGLAILKNSFNPAYSSNADNVWIATALRYNDIYEYDRLLGLTYYNYDEIIVLYSRILCGIGASLYNNKPKANLAEFYTETIKDKIIQSASRFLSEGIQLHSLSSDEAKSSYFLSKEIIDNTLFNNAHRLFDGSKSDETESSKIDWEQRRYEIAKAVQAAHICAGAKVNKSEHYVDFADALIRALKKRNNQEIQ